MKKLTTDETTYRSSYADGEYNAEMEVEATRLGLCIDERTTIPWDWILAALSYRQSKGLELDVSRKQEA